MATAYKIKLTGAQLEAILVACQASDTVLQDATKDIVDLKISRAIMRAEIDGLRADVDALLARLDERLPFSIKSFTGSKQYEKGTTQTAYLSWAYEGDIESQSIYWVEKGVTYTPAVNDRSMTVPYVDSDATFVLKANGKEASVKITFQNPKYWGVFIDLSEPRSSEEFLAAQEEERIEKIVPHTATKAVNITFSANNAALVYWFPKSMGSSVIFQDAVTNWVYQDIEQLPDIVLNGESYCGFKGPISSVDDFTFKIT